MFPSSRKQEVDILILERGLTTMASITNVITTTQPTYGAFTTASVETLSGAGAIPITSTIVEWTTTGADAGTLADGTAGQHLYIVMVVDGGDGTLTPTTLNGGTTITFDAVGDAVHLLYGTAGWSIVGQNGVLVA